jgi:hypothetical protein
MKKLDDIPKKNVFNTPEGYFDKLPGIIQSRIAEKQPERSSAGAFALVLRYAVPVLAIGVVLFFVFRQSNSMTSPEELLANVSTEELTTYLVDSEFTTEELLDIVELDDLDIDALNDEVLSQDFDNDVLQEYADEFLLEL